MLDEFTINMVREALAEIKYAADLARPDGGVLSNSARLTVFNACDQAESALKMVLRQALAPTD